RPLAAQILTPPREPQPQPQPQPRCHNLRRGRRRSRLVPQLVTPRAALCSQTW
ncbi:unnamed protein product, partial [Musa acuminata subsp. burmannicoides]